MMKIYLNLKESLSFNPSLLKKLFFLIMVLVLGFSSSIFAQPDSIKARIQQQQNEISQPIDLPFDTTQPTINRQTIDLNDVIISEDAVDAPVIYNADDSMHLEAKTQIVHLYGNATVKYETFSLRANYIALDVEKKLVIAEGLPDSTGRVSGYPVFADETQSFTAKKIKYNFETQKGIIYDITTEQQGGYIRGGKAKIKIGVVNDSIKQANDEFYSSDAIFTTCDHEIPHFGIRSTKQKVIPNKEVIVGPSNLEIMGIPTPLWIPFGFFPLNIEQSSGLIFPRDYESSPTLGFGLRNVGWYFGINDNWDLQLTGSIFTRGSFGVNAAFRYKHLYKNNGRFNIGYDRYRTGDPQVASEFSVQNVSRISWSHNQDSKAHPSQSFSASVNLTLGNNQQFVNDAATVLTNQLNSNITYSKRWIGKPYRLSISANHNQNNRTRVFNVTLPQMDFQVNRITPFEKKSGGGKPSWYEKVGFSYSVQARNSITATDTTIFTREALNDAQYGVKHTIPLSTQFTVLKYFQVSPNINYNERWYFNTTRRTFNDELIINADTTFDGNNDIVSIAQDTTFGIVEEFKQNEFRALREFNATVSVSTQLFGTLNNLKIGRLRALRHTVKPSASYNYRPDFTTKFWGYFDEVQQDTRYPDEFQQYSIFEDGIYGSASSAGLSSAIGFNINNLIEGKIQEKGDTTNSVKNYKKIQLLRSFNISGNYNFAADSLNLSTISMRGNTMLFKKITVSFNAIFDPYAANTETNGRINTFEWTENRRPARLTSAGLTMTTSLRWNEIQDILQGKSEDDNSKTNPATNNPGISYVDNIRLGYDIRMSQKYFGGIDSTFLSTHALSLSGTVNLTSQWKITVGRIGYDFVKKQLTYPDFQFYRSLHCWEMGTSWQPQRGTYSFFIRVRQAPLDFINIPYGRGNYDIIPNF